VRRFALFLTGDEAQADDLTSETFLRLWTATDRLDSATLRSYLLTIVRNLHRDHLRREGRRETLQDSVAAPDARMEAGIDARAELTRVLKLAAGLTPLDRAVLFERALEGRSYEEIARRHAISKAAARVRVCRARLRLLLAKN
jgi:RNA polymerase sigma-70 factor (ECF subfamily)